MKAICCDCRKKFVLKDEVISEHAQRTHTVVSDYYPDDGGWKCKDCAQEQFTNVKENSDV